MAIEFEDIDKSKVYLIRWSNKYIPAPSYEILEVVITKIAEEGKAARILHLRNNKEAWIHWLDYEIVDSYYKL